MSDQTIAMSFYAMEKMADEFKKSAQLLAEMEAKVKEMAGQIENGALQGKAGDTLREALQDKLVAKLTKTKGEFEELEKNVREAAHEMQNADEISGGYYKS